MCVCVLVACFDFIVENCVQCRRAQSDRRETGCNQLFTVTTQFLGSHTMGHQYSVYPSNGLDSIYCDMFRADVLIKKN